MSYHKILLYHSWHLTGHPSSALTDDISVAPRLKRWVRGDAAREALRDIESRHIPHLGLLDIFVEPCLNEPRYHKEVLKADTPPFQTWGRGLNPNPNKHQDLESKTFLK